MLKSVQRSATIANEREQREQKLLYISLTVQYISIAPPPAFLLTFAFAWAIERSSGSSGVSKSTVRSFCLLLYSVCVRGRREVWMDVKAIKKRRSLAVRVNTGREERRRRRVGSGLLPVASV